MAKKLQKKICNWSEYNKSLVNLLRFEEGYVERLYYQGAQHRSGPRGLRRGDSETRN